MIEAAKLLNTDHRVYIVASGAGAGLQKTLWDVPGISKILVGAEFPYAKEATDRFLGFTPPESYSSRETAVSLALEAYLRAFQVGGAPPVGLGLTGSVASTTAHRGEHRVYVATVTDKGCDVWSAILIKGFGNEPRKRDGEICDRLGLLALLTACGLEASEAVGYEIFCFEQEIGFDALPVLLQHPLFTPSGKRLKAPSNGNGLVLFPGAFNPPHEGHYWMAKEHQATFHITINPPHKPALTVGEMLQRAKMLEGFPVLFTKDDPLYLDKARRFPGAKILVGVDAMERMLEPKWGVEVGPLLQEFRQLGIKLLVADRELNGKVMTLDDLKNAPEDICQRILRPAQHLGMSSTKIREAAQCV